MFDSSSPTISFSSFFFGIRNSPPSILCPAVKFVASAATSRLPPDTRFVESRVEKATPFTSFFPCFRARYLASLSVSLAGLKEWPCISARCLDSSVSLAGLKELSCFSTHAPISLWDEEFFMPIGCVLYISCSTTIRRKMRSFSLLFILKSNRELSAITIDANFLPMARVQYLKVRPQRLLKCFLSLQPRDPGLVGVCGR
jgi:hypothetical protein